MSEKEDLDIIMDYINLVVKETPEEIGKSCKDKNLQDKVKKACQRLNSLSKINPLSENLQQHIDSLKKYIILSSLSRPAGIRLDPSITREQYEAIIDIYQKPYKGGKRKNRTLMKKRKSIKNKRKSIKNKRKSTKNKRKSTKNKR